MFIGHHRNKIIAVLLISGWGFVNQTVAIANEVDPQLLDNGCPVAVLERLTSHTVEAGETVASIAEDYSLSTSSILAFNPTLQSGLIRAGDRLQIPPYNGSIQAVASGTTWQMLADRYRMRADVLFETNGCGMTPPSQIFLPSAEAQIRGEGRPPVSTPDPPTFDITPVSEGRPILTPYGWQPNSDSNQLVFHPGVDFLVPMDTEVRSVADGIVAFVGDREEYGLLVVINHEQGIQTRYAQLSSTQVNLGDSVSIGQTIGQSGQSGAATRPHLHFEVRLNSPSGWLAQDPVVYLNPLQP